MLCSGEWETGTPPHHQLSAEGRACAAKTGPASPDNLDEELLFHPAEPLTHPARTVNYAWCRKQLLTVLFIFDVLFVLHQWSTTLNNVLILISFFFFFPEGFSSMASEGFASLDDLSLPTSLWGQCHLPVTDGKQTGTGSKWVTQSHVVFCHLWGDGNSASSNRSLRLSHYVCYSLCREWSTAKPTLKATLYTQPVMTRTRSTPLPRPTKLKLQLSMF